MAPSVRGRVCRLQCRVGPPPLLLLHAGPRHHEVGDHGVVLLSPHFPP